MGSIDKTSALQRLTVPLSRLVKNADNPNRMSAREFDLLCDNLGKTGMTDAILVREIEPDAAGPLWRIVGGHHRYSAAAFLGWEDVPITVLPDDFDDEQEKFQLVRMNAIRGKLDPTAFFNLYSQLSAKYSEEILQDAFGFAEEAEFKKLIAQTAKLLPDKHLQEKFKQAAAEIKTIDGLSALLNKMFTQYGDTLPYGYLIVDYGGQQSMWLRSPKKTMDALAVIGMMCIDKKRTLDDVIGGLVRSIAKGELKDAVAALIAASPEVQLPDPMSLPPTKDNIEKLAAAS